MASCEPLTRAQYPLCPGVSLAPSSPRVVLCLYPGDFPFRQEMAVGFRLTQDAPRLDHFLETPQQGILGFAFTYSYF